MSEKPALTESQDEMLKRINDIGKISWYITQPSETRLLNTLMIKGYVTWDESDKSWSKR